MYQWFRKVFFLFSLHFSFNELYFSTRFIIVCFFFSFKMNSFLCTDCVAKFFFRITTRDNYCQHKVFDKMYIWIGVSSVVCRLAKKEMIHCKSFDKLNTIYSFSASLFFFSTLRSRGGWIDFDLRKIYSPQR